MPTNDSPSGVAPLADLVAYQDDAIVSKILLKKEKGSVTLFAFDRGQGLSEHTVPHDALVFVVDGAAEIRIDAETHRLAAGDVLVLPGGRPHQVDAVERFKMVLTMIRD
jgi:quercetin dioxygenase-like cupin family protein